MSGKTYLEVGGKRIKKIFYVGENAIDVEIKKAFSHPGARNVFSSGHVVYYHVDTDITIEHEVDDGADCIANAPDVIITKPGYSLCGWREDDIASPTTCEAKICDNDDIHLYAVLVSPVYVIYDGNGNTGGNTERTESYIYYNNGNNLYPYVNLSANAFVKTGYDFDVWAENSSSPYGTLYPEGSSVELTGDLRLYACWIDMNEYSRTFNYTGGIQSYTAPVTGDYRLEVYGAQGGNVSIPVWGVYQSGGSGGVSKGNVHLDAGETIYICVGGAGNYAGNSQVGGGYNGGGTGGSSSYGSYAASGGGATHIAKTNRGVLSDYNSYRSEVILVAGGGGGALYQNQYTPPGEEDRSTYRNGGAGNGTSRLTNNFGYGATGNSGGGSGYFGGYGGDVSSDSAGGSGYVGGCIEGTTSMQYGGRSGNGQAKIILVSRTFNYTGGIQSYTVPATGTYQLEVYGAAGSSINSFGGGAGGYAKGNVQLNSNDIIYVCVGGAGSGRNGGYNGGGAGSTPWRDEDWVHVKAGGGGGATHIGKSNATLARTQVSNLLIAAGGGGGGASCGGVVGPGGGYGGAGGGESGGPGCWNGYNARVSGGTQSGGAAYGQGGNGSSNGTDYQAGGGGGGGYYGGQGGYGTDDEGRGCSGAGGSGYIGGVTNGSMSNSSRSGNGFAKITYVLS